MNLETNENDKVTTTNITTKKKVNMSNFFNKSAKANSCDLKKETGTTIFESESDNILQHSSVKSTDKSVEEVHAVSSFQKTYKIDELLEKHATLNTYRQGHSSNKFSTRDTNQFVDAKPCAQSNSVISEDLMEQEMLQSESKSSMSENQAYQFQEKEVINEYSQRKYTSHKITKTETSEKIDKKVINQNKNSLEMSHHSVFQKDQLHQNDKKSLEHELRKEYTESSSLHLSETGKTYTSHDICAAEKTSANNVIESFNMKTDNDPFVAFTQGNIQSNPMSHQNYAQRNDNDNKDIKRKRMSEDLNLYEWGKQREFSSIKEFDYLSKEKIDVSDKELPREGIYKAAKENPNDNDNKHNQSNPYDSLNKRMDELQALIRKSSTTLTGKKINTANKSDVGCNKTQDYSSYTASAEESHYSRSTAISKAITNASKLASILATNQNEHSATISEGVSEITANSKKCSHATDGNFSHKFESSRNGSVSSASIIEQTYGKLDKTYVEGCIDRYGIKNDFTKENNSSLSCPNKQEKIDYETNIKQESESLLVEKFDVNDSGHTLKMYRVTISPTPSPSIQFPHHFKPITHPEDIRHRESPPDAVINLATSRRAVINTPTFRITPSPETLNKRGQENQVHQKKKQIHGGEISELVSTGITDLRNNPHKYKEKYLHLDIAEHITKSKISPKTSPSTVSLKSSPRTKQKVINDRTSTEENSQTLSHQHKEVTNKMRCNYSKYFKKHETMNIKKINIDSGHDSAKLYRVTISPTPSGDLDFNKNRRHSGTPPDAVIDLSKTHRAVINTTPLSQVSDNVTMEYDTLKSKLDTTYKRHESKDITAQVTNSLKTGIKTPEKRYVHDKSHISMNLPTQKSSYDSNKRNSPERAKSFDMIEAKATLPKHKSKVNTINENSDNKYCLYCDSYYNKQYHSQTIGPEHLCKYCETLYAKPLEQKHHSYTPIRLNFKQDKKLNNALVNQIMRKPKSIVNFQNNHKRKSSLRNISNCSQLANKVFIKVKSDEYDITKRENHWPKEFCEYAQEKDRTKKMSQFMVKREPNVVLNFKNIDQRRKKLYRKIGNSKGVSKKCFVKINTKSKKSFEIDPKFWEQKLAEEQTEVPKEEIAHYYAEKQPKTVVRFKTGIPREVNSSFNKKRNKKYVNKVSMKIKPKKHKPPIKIRISNEESDSDKEEWSDDCNEKFFPKSIKLKYQNNKKHYVRSKKTTPKIKVMFYNTAKKKKISIPVTKRAKVVLNFPRRKLIQLEVDKYSTNPEKGMCFKPFKSALFFL